VTPTTITTLPEPSGPVPFDKLFARSWQVFRRNWIVALPPIIAGIVMVMGVVVFLVAIAAAAFASTVGHGSSAAIGALVLGYLAFVVFGIVLSLWAYVAMFGMADAAWTRGTATFADGFVAFRERGGATFVAWIGIFLLAICALILTLPTLGLALLAFPVAVMYVMPSVVVGRRGGFEAIGESFRLVRRYFAHSAITALVLVAILYGISMIGGFAIFPVEMAAMPQGSQTEFRMPPIPLLVGGGLGYVISIIASTAYYGFVATILVGMYRDLVSQPEPVPVIAGYPAAPVPPSPAAPVPPPAVPPQQDAPPPPI
jgi:hypothetical protein